MSTRTRTRPPAALELMATNSDQYNFELDTADDHKTDLAIEEAILPWMAGFEKRYHPQEYENDLVICVCGFACPDSEVCSSTRRTRSPFCSSHVGNEGNGSVRPYGDPFRCHPMKSTDQSCRMHELAAPRLYHDPQRRTTHRLRMAHCNDLSILWSNESSFVICVSQNDIRAF